MEDSSEFIRVGDRVKLRSGGHEMTVVSRIKKPYGTTKSKFRCAWHTSSGDNCSGVFPALALVRIQDGPHDLGA